VASSVQTFLEYNVFSLYGLAPPYLGPLNYVADSPGRRLAVPPVKLTTVANRALPVVGPRTLNDLPDDMASAESSATQNSPVHEILFLTISWTKLHSTVSGGTSSIFLTQANLKIPG